MAYNLCYLPKYLVPVGNVVSPFLVAAMFQAKDQALLQAMLQVLIVSKVAFEYSSWAPKSSSKQESHQDMLLTIICG